MGSHTFVQAHIGIILCIFVTDMLILIFIYSNLSNFGFNKNGEIYISIKPSRTVNLSDGRFFFFFAWFFLRCILHGCSP